MQWQDVGRAWRTWRAAPGSAVAIVLTLGLGLGATTAVFSAVHGILMAPLPFDAPDRIVAVWEASPTSRRMGVSAPNARDWAATATTFEAMAAFAGGRATAVGGRTPVVAGVFAVSGDFFRVLGVRPALGRTWTPDERTPNGPAAVVVSHGFWQRVLGAPSDLAGVTLRVDGTTASVIGVLPQGIAYPEGAEIWTARERRDDTSGRTAHNWRVIARLAPGVPLAAAQAEMTAIAQRLEAAYGDDHDAIDAAVVPLHEEVVGRARPLLLLLLASVAVVLVAACVNAGHVLLARASQRRRELAVHLALGADRARLVRMLLAECLLLAVVAGVMGLAIAGGLVRLLVAAAPPGLPRLAAVGLHGPVVAFGVLLALVLPLAFGVAPALQASRADVREALADGGRTMTAGRGRARHALLAAEVTLAVLMLVGAGLLVRSLAALARVDPGFSPDGVLTLTTTVPPERAQGADVAAGFYRQVLERVTALPGVAGAGLVNSPPLSGLDANGGFMFEGQAWAEVRGNWASQSATYRMASAGYFDALGIPIRRGRTFDGRDVAGAETVAVVNEAMARRYFPGADPVGRRIRFAGMDSADEPWLTIIGVVGDVRFRDLGTPAEPEVYVHFAQRPARTASFVTTAVRLAPGATAAAVGPALRDAVATLAPDVPAEVASMTALVDRAVAARRFLMLALVVFSACALALAAVGVYGVTSVLVAGRTAEIGVRLALGATPAVAAAAILRGPLTAVIAGLVGGMALAAGLSGVLRAFLYEVSPGDPLAFAAAALLLALAAAAAAWMPARRAVTTSPIEAMRAS